MKILYHLLYRHSTGADRWIAEAWQVGFEYHGNTFDYYDGRRIDAEAIKASGADLFMTDIGILKAEDTSALQTLRADGIKVAVWVHWPLDANKRHIESALRNIDFADVYYGEREPEGMGDFEKATGKSYITLANAARHDIHKPAPFDPALAYDIAFVGAYLPRKKWMNDLILNELKPRYRVGLFGPGWTLRDQIIGYLARAARKARLTSLAAFFDRKRITLPLEKEPALYSSSKICINFHERMDDGRVDHNIINQRLFKIAASGGFQIVDDMPGIHRYFDKDAIVTLPVDKAAWLKTIDYYLNNDAERERMRMTAARHAPRHYSSKRVELLLQTIAEKRQTASA